MSYGTNTVKGVCIRLTDIENTDSHCGKSRTSKIDAAYISTSYRIFPPHRLRYLNTLQTYRLTLSSPYTWASPCSTLLRSGFPLLSHLLRFSNSDQLCSRYQAFPPRLLHSACVSEPAVSLSGQRSLVLWWYCLRHGAWLTFCSDQCLTTRPYHSISMERCLTIANSKGPYSKIVLPWEQCDFGLGYADPCVHC